MKSELYHHGVTGQKWGVKHGPPYPLTQSDQVKRLYDELSGWEYGYKTNGKRYGEDSGYYDLDFSKWKTRSVKELKNDKIGNCWDFTNYTNYILNKNNINNDNYMLYLDFDGNPDNAVTHSFTILYLDGKTKWIEQSAWPVRGLHDVSGPEDVLNAMQSKIYGTDNNAYIFKYDPKGMDQGLTSDKYAEIAMKDDPIYERERIKHMDPYLEHHGIAGQKWETRNGPPYPLNPKQYSALEKYKASQTKDAKKVEKTILKMVDRYRGVNDQAYKSSMGALLNVEDRLRGIENTTYEDMLSDKKIINKGKTIVATRFGVALGSGVAAAFVGGSHLFVPTAIDANIAAVYGGTKVRRELIDKQIERGQSGYKPNTWKQS